VDAIAPLDVLLYGMVLLGMAVAVYAGSKHV
jgi:hypothetical protein